MLSPQLNNILFSLFTVMSVAAVFAAATVCVYIYFRDLRVDASGKSEFNFVISLLLMCLAFPFFQVYSLIVLQAFSTVLLVSGFILLFLWISVLSFDVWWTIR